MDEPRVPLPWSRGCFVCGADNPIGLRGRSYKVGERIELEFVPREEHAGWSQVIHGGLVTTVLDEVMTWSAIVALRRACFAADFTVRLRRPLSPRTRCTAVAWVASTRRRIVESQAELVGEDGNVFATAQGRYMPMPVDKLRHMGHDLVTGPGTWPVEGIFDVAEEPGADGHGH